MNEKQIVNKENNFKKVVETLNLKFPVAEISKKTGFGQGLISKLLNGKTEPSANFLAIFNKAYNLDYNKEFKNAEPATLTSNYLQQRLAAKNGEKTPHLIPFYDSGAIGGTNMVADINNGKPAAYINAGSWFKDATGTTIVYGDSMYPKYPQGCGIAYKEVLDRDLIVYGQDYIIETSEYRLIKRLQKNNDKEHLRACSYNKEKDEYGNTIHEDLEVPVGKITRLFKVLGKVILNEGVDLNFQ